MQLTTAARLFESLGSEAKLGTFLRIAASPAGLPLAVLRARSGPGPDQLSAILAGLQAAGLVTVQGERDALWFSANGRLLAEALAFAGCGTSAGVARVTPSGRRA
jgi:hypothetical protein